jgi:hypothetical protein
MKKIAGVISIVLAVLFLMLPAAALAATSSLATDCKYDTVKWEDNPLSCKLYLNNWGKTPLESMSRLAGIQLPINQKSIIAGCLGVCASCNDQVGNLGACTGANCKNDTECPNPATCGVPVGTTPCNPTAIYGGAHCMGYWGVSLAFSNRSWAGDTLTNPRTPNGHPMYMGDSDRRDTKGGGDWGITGCSFSECSADAWCLTCNMDANGACKLKK